MYTSQNNLHGLRLSASHFEKSATDFHVKEKRLGERPSVVLLRDSISHYSTVVFKLDVPYLWRVPVSLSRMELFTPEIIVMMQLSMMDQSLGPLKHRVCFFDPHSGYVCKLWSRLACGILRSGLENHRVFTL